MDAELRQKMRELEDALSLYINFTVDQQLRAMDKISRPAGAEIESLMN